VYKTHHPKANKHRLYVKMKAEGRAWLQNEAVHKTEITDIADYWRTKHK